MAIEYADLTASRMEDTRYENDVIFDKEGLAELLAHIRDYPIIDIEEIMPDGVDELNPDLLIWDNYTDGAPCIKIRYGDITNNEGNLTPADREKIKKIQKKINAWNTIYAYYKKSQSIESEYTSLIKNLQQEINSIIETIYEAYYNKIHYVLPTESTPGHFVGSLFDTFGVTEDKQAAIYFLGATRKDFTYVVLNIAANIDEYLLQTEEQLYEIDFVSKKLTDRNKIDENTTYNSNDWKDHYPDNLTETEQLVFSHLNNNCISYLNLAPQGNDLQTIEKAVSEADFNAVLNRGSGSMIEDLTDAESLQLYTAIMTYNDLYNNLEDMFNRKSPTNDTIGHIKSLFIKYLNYIKKARLNMYQDLATLMARYEVLGNDYADLVATITDYQDLFDNGNYIEAIQEINNYLNSQSLDNLQAEIKRIEDEAAAQQKTIGYVRATEFNSKTTYWELNGDTYIQVIEPLTEAQFNNGIYYRQISINPIAGYKYIKIGNDIKFKDIINNGISKNIEPITEDQIWKNGTFRVTIDSKTYEVPINGFIGDTNAIKLSGHLLPDEDATWDIGSNSDNDSEQDGVQKLRWRNLYLSNSLGGPNDYIPNAYITNGNITNLTVNGNSIDSTNLNIVTHPSSTTTAETTKVFWRGDCSWSNTLENPSSDTSDVIMKVKNNNIGTSVQLEAAHSGNHGIWSAGYYADNTFTTDGKWIIYRDSNNRSHSALDFIAPKVYNAVFNDYAEYRTTINLTPGHVVVDNDDGSLSCSSQRLQPGAQIISDTFGHSMGETDNAKTPIAVAGRVLAYIYQSRDKYHAGMAVCSAPNGTVDIMTREEIRDYPDCIIGIVSEIPQYEYWGSDNVKVDGRIWIKIK